MIQNQQIEHQKNKIYTFQNFQFHFHYRVMSKIVLIKTQKPQLALLSRWSVKLRAFQAEHPCLNPTSANFYFFLYVFFHCKLILRTFIYMFLKQYGLFLCNLSLKLGKKQNSFMQTLQQCVYYYSKPCILFEQPVIL